MEILLAIIIALGLMALFITQSVENAKLRDENLDLIVENVKLKIKVERRDAHIEKLRSRLHLPKLEEGAVDAEN